jgi:hypothetical protein
VGESLHIEGLLRIYEVDDELLDRNFLIRWWRHCRKKGWKYLTLAEKAREGKLVVEAHNQILSAGRTQLLTFAGSNTTTVAFAQYYSVGTGTIYSVQPGDTSLATELFRAVPASFTIVGNGVTVTTNFTSGQALGTYTNSALFGNGATSTPGSGTMMTHILYSYTHTAIAIVNDYTISMT